MQLVVFFFVSLHSLKSHYPLPICLCRCGDSQSPLTPSFHGGPLRRNSEETRHRLRDSALRHNSEFHLSLCVPVCVMWACANAQLIKWCVWMHGGDPLGVCRRLFVQTQSAVCMCVGVCSVCHADRLRPGQLFKRPPCGSICIIGYVSTSAASSQVFSPTEWLLPRNLDAAVL